MNLSSNWVLFNWEKFVLDVLWMGIWGIWVWMHNHVWVICYGRRILTFQVIGDCISNVVVNFVWKVWFWVLIDITITLVSIACFVVCFWVWFDIVLGKIRVWQWGNSISLTQASLSRLGESCRTSRLVWGRVARPDDFGLVLSDWVSLRRGTARLSKVARKLERFWAWYLAQARRIGVLSDSVSLKRGIFAWARLRYEMTWLSGSSSRRGNVVALSDGATRPGEGISPKRDNV